MIPTSMISDQVHSLCKDFNSIDIISHHKINRPAPPLKLCIFIDSQLIHTVKLFLSDIFFCIITVWYFTALSEHVYNLKVSKSW